jgi:hypothetical protein
MDQLLAQIYGTGGSEDLEKTAQALMLEKLAAQEQVDLSQFSPEELEALQQEVFGANGGQQIDPQQAQLQQLQGQGGFNPQAFQQPQGLQQGFDPAQIQQAQMLQLQQAQQQGAIPPELLEQAAQQLLLQQQQAQGQQPQFQQPQGQFQQDGGQDQAALEQMAVKEAQAKFEEADFLGRVMAHACHQEMQKIAGMQKRASMDQGLPAGFGESKPRLANPAHPSSTALDSAASNGPGHTHPGGKLRRAVSHLTDKAKGLGGAAANLAKAHPGKAALGIGAAGLGAGALAHHAMSGKEKNAFDQLAEQRAVQILAENGIPNGGPPAQQAQQAQQPVQQAQPQVTPQQFGEALEKRAYELLAQAGYLG